MPFFTFQARTSEHAVNLRTLLLGQRSLPSKLKSMARPIGVFDSGVGGLTVLKALRARLPGRDFIYFSDTARVPYGRKPRDMVRGFAYEITAFLLQQDVAAIVVACNTASASALPDLAAETP